MSQNAVHIYDTEVSDSKGNSIAVFVYYYYQSFSKYQQAKNTQNNMHYVIQNTSKCYLLSVSDNNKNSSHLNCISTYWHFM